MTKFEQDVAAALAASHASWCDRHCDCHGEDEAVRLAPRVAAAIEAAMYAGYEVEIERGRALGLAALRGTSGETPRP